jgi:hypothetical protein
MEGSRTLAGIELVTPGNVNSGHRRMMELYFDHIYAVYDPGPQLVQVSSVREIGCGVKTQYNAGVTG